MTKKNRARRYVGNRLALRSFMLAQGDARRRVLREELNRRRYLRRVSEQTKKLFEDTLGDAEIVKVESRFEGDTIHSTITAQRNAAVNLVETTVRVKT